MYFQGKSFKNRRNRSSGLKRTEKNLKIVKKPKVKKSDEEGMVLAMEKKQRKERWSEEDYGKREKFCTLDDIRSQSTGFNLAG